jgi:glycosyltransferase involved in cell wall biosynthesis
MLNQSELARARVTEADRTGPAESEAGRSTSRVLLVAPQPFFTAAGTPLNILEMCRALTEGGFEVHLATLPMGETIEVPGLIYRRVARVPLFEKVPIGFSLAKMVYGVLLAGTVVRLLRRQRFVAVHAIEEGAFYAVPIARWFRTPAIADLDSDLVGQLRTNPSAAVRLLAGAAGVWRRRALRWASCAITVAPALTRLVGKLSPQTPVFEIPDVAPAALLRPSDPGAMAGLRSDLALGDGPVVVYTGNFDRRQGEEALIDAIPGVRARIADAVLLLVGGDPETAERLRARSRTRYRPGGALRRPASDRADAGVHGARGGARLAPRRAAGDALEDIRLHGERSADRGDRSADPHRRAGPGLGDPGTADRRGPGGGYRAGSGGPAARLAPGPRGAPQGRAAAHGCVLET